MIKYIDNRHEPWLRKIGDSNTSNYWRHLENHHPSKDPRSKKAKALVEESQGTLDEFVGQIGIPSKVNLESKIERIP